MIDRYYFQAIGQIIRTGHWITDQIGTELKDFDITEPQYNVLRILKVKNGEPITVQEIQEKMVQRTSNVTRLIDKLLNKRLVNRTECSSNRRKMDITITDDGIALLEDLDKKVRQFHSPMMENLTQDEAMTLSKLIVKLKGDKK